MYIHVDLFVWSSSPNRLSSFKKGNIFFLFVSIFPGFNSRAWDILSAQMNICGKKKTKISKHWTLHPTSYNIQEKIKQQRKQTNEKNLNTF